MTTSLDKVLREYATTEAGLTLAAGQWGQAQDTGRAKLMRRDGVTSDWIETASRLAGQTSTTGAALIGSAGITGITPNGGTSGGAATLANMLTGIRDSVVLKSPYNSTINTVQPTADYVPMNIKGFAAGTSNLLNLGPSTGSTAWFDNAGNLTLSQSVAADVSLRIINTNNASGSANAKLLLSVGGASAGDPFVNYSISGGQQWSEGIDRSDSNKFKLSMSSALGSSDVLTFTTGALGTMLGDFTVTGNGLYSGTLGVTGNTTVSRSAVGSAVTLTAQNTATSSSGSAAIINIVTASGGGDAILQFTNGSSAGAYYMGVDRVNGRLIINSGSGTLLASSSAALYIDGNTITIPNGDLVVDRSSSGAQVVSTLANLSNTASSDAKMLIQTAGGSAGNPYLHFKVVSNYDWSIGPQVSASGAFKISKSTALGTNDALIINSSLLVTVPNAFTVTGTLTAGVIAATGDLTISRSNAGGLVRAYIENSDNSNGASNAQLFLTVGGASAGDPYIRFDINSIVDWSIGIDNSDSDNFKISRSGSLGTSDVLVIDSSLIAYFAGSIKMQGGAGTFLQLPVLASDPSGHTLGRIYANTGGHLIFDTGSAFVQVV